ncbi:egl nine homolog 1-like [Babylonia areolata]|uniref:egl nine homolog 1-like n=1 Tax=Babylonia areolata TaxID=304850 RepID=UPI003FD3E6D7
MADDASASGLRDDRNVCQLCGALENLSLCGGCHNTWYCCKDHQREDWKLHKRTCKEKQKQKSKEAKQREEEPSSSYKTSGDTNPVGEQSKGTEDKVDTTVPNSQSDDKQAGEEDSEPGTSQTTAEAVTEEGNSQRDPVTSGKKKTKGAGKNKKGGVLRNETGQLPAIAEEGSNERYFLDAKDFPQDIKSKHKARAKRSAKTNMAPEGSTVNTKDAYVDVLMSRFDATAKYVVECLNRYGICVMDSFLGEMNGQEILNEVKMFKESGLMRQGQVVHSGASTSGKIRGDIITWVDGREPHCENIRYLVSCMDAVVLKCSSLLDSYTINERTKAMVACYPGHASGYVRHVDNPNQDGRCITCIYYLNKNWDVRRDGGMLRIYPEGMDRVADIEPKFDRVLFFWSDRRNPHEVLPSNKERYAITVWYYEAEERARALKRFKGEVATSPKKQSVPLFPRPSSSGDHGDVSTKTSDTCTTAVSR